MKAYIESPAKVTPELFTEIYAKISNDIKHYNVIFVLKDKRCASGTLVTINGYHGILTAHHVAEPVMNEREVGLCIAEKAHGLLLRTAHCQHVPIGIPKNEFSPELGPDLSFIIIRDVKLLETLRSIKSFCNLEKRDLEYFESPLNKMSWFISGSPFEASAQIETSPNNELVKFQNFIGHATFHSQTEDEGFDFFKLIVPSGQGNFPINCKGMSGGGMWLVPITIEDENNLDTIRNEIPILAGVSFCQSAVKNDERIITGHSYKSIYFRLRETLNGLK